jgi:hypothetical protein
MVFSVAMELHQVHLQSVLLALSTWDGEP